MNLLGTRKRKLPDENIARTFEVEGFKEAQGRHIETAQEDKGISQ